MSDGGGFTEHLCAVTAEHGNAGQRPVIVSQRLFQGWSASGGDQPSATAVRWMTMPS